MLTIAALFEQLDETKQRLLLQAIQAGLANATRAGEAIVDAADWNTVAELRDHLEQAIGALETVRELIRERP